MPVTLAPEGPHEVAAYELSLPERNVYLDVEVTWLRGSDGDVFRVHFGDDDGWHGYEVELDDPIEDGDHTEVIEEALDRYIDDYVDDDET